ncbi:hypothetical protein VIGAN_02285400 [Vigna angularis var. angularis]|uniref:Uncharacterized protein n=1 Tax=Vigna angularis var. angularis TaxID=157739 RepID=A0A0S3RGZ5_PHAAN|nr:hypothetical protein VIGAN_02285400 [Vigna angularis var. angularis]
MIFDNHGSIQLVLGPSDISVHCFCQSVLKCIPFIRSYQVLFFQPMQQHIHKLTIIILYGYFARQFFRSLYYTTFSILTIRLITNEGDPVQV